MQDTANPSFPSSDETPQPETPTNPPAFDNSPPSTPIAGMPAELPPDPNMTTPTSAPDLTVPEPPQFPNGDNTPAPSPMDPPVMVRGENTIPNMAAASPGLTTATILPVSSGGNDMISYSSGGSGRRIILPVVIVSLILLAVLGGAVFFFTQNAPQEGIEAPATTEENSEVVPTEEPTPEAQLTTATYQNTEFGFSLDYPQDWIQKENVNGNVVVFTDSATGPSSPSKVSVLSEATLSELTVYGESLQKIFSQLYTGWVNVNTTPTTSGSLQALEVESTYTKGAVNMSVLQLIVIREGKAFTITAEAEETAFLDLRDSYSQILASLQFSN